jgi:RHS repeat-associated protein
MVWNAVNNSLTSISFKEGNKDKEYFYNYLSDGQRLSKTVDEKTTIYIYNAGMLLAEDNPDYRINYYYDASGIATEIGYSKKDNGKYAKEEYFFFTRNGQGDIVGIYRSSDSKRMGTYEYDLWGNPVTIEATADDSLGITEKNPLRYRGYYYDRETKFYYLNARYYDPEIHRFISTDSVIAGVSSDVLGYNLFTYCDNDPVNKIDTTGNWPKLTNKQKIAVGLAVIAVAAVLTVATGGAAAGTVVAAVNCFATGALQGAVIGAATGAVSGAAINGGIAFVTSGFDLEKTKQAAIDGACDGFMSGAITGFVTGGMTSSHCFVAGTLVETIDGPIPIEQIEEGEFVLSEDPETGDVTYKRVLETYVNETNELVHLNIDGEEVVTTPAHPFYVKDLGFVLAGDLEEGTTLVDNVRGKMNLPSCR